MSCYVTFQIVVVVVVVDEISFCNFIDMMSNSLLFAGQLSSSIFLFWRRVFAKVYMDMLDEKKTVLMKPLPLPKNVHASPFSGQCWVFVILIWAVLAILFNAFEDWTNHSTQ